MLHYGIGPNRGPILPRNMASLGQTTILLGGNSLWQCVFRNVIGFVINEEVMIKKLYLQNCL